MFVLVLELFKLLWPLPPEGKGKPDGVGGGKPKPESIIGTELDDTLDFTGEKDALQIDALSGDDVVTGGNKNDIILGGDGNDTLGGGLKNGKDDLYGGAGNDTLVIDADDTVIDGGSGQNTVIVSDAETRGVTLDLATSQIKTAIGGVGDDLFDATGDTQGVVIDGGEGRDVLLGSGVDAIDGGVGNDFLMGNAGNDALEGTDIDVSTLFWTVFQATFEIVSKSSGDK